VTIGRGPSNDVALGWDTEVSRLHAELERLAGEWTVVDDGLSRNGTWLNGQRIQGRQRLRDGDVVQIGQTVLAVGCPARRTPARRSRERARRRARAHAGTAPRARGAVPALQGVRARHPGDQPADRRGALPERRRRQGPPAALFGAFGVEELPQNQKRSVLAMRALQLGVVR
jgi:pSer/pThr/pTyr-binding forkhead associated (FHA) protein